MITTGYFCFSPAHFILPGKGAAYLLSAKGCCLQDLAQESLPSFPDKTLSYLVLPLKCWGACGAKSAQWPSWRGKEWLSSFLVIWTVMGVPNSCCLSLGTSSLTFHHSKFQPWMDQKPGHWARKKEENLRLGKYERGSQYHLLHHGHQAWSKTKLGKEETLCICNISVLKIRFYDLNCQGIILTIIEWPEKSWDLH